MESSITGSNLLTSVLEAALPPLGFLKDTPLRHSLRTQVGLWTVEGFQEPGLSGERIRLHWGLLIPGEATIRGLEELGGSQHATLNGDVGAYATGRRGPLWVSIKGSGSRAWLPGRLSPEQAEDQLLAWLPESVMRLQAELGDLQAVQKFIAAQGPFLTRTQTWPWTPEAQAETRVAVALLAGEADAAKEALRHWLSLFGDAVDSEGVQRQLRRFEQRLDEL